MNTLQPDTHLTEQEVEDFALGRVQRSRAPEMLEHLLFCDECNDRVEAEQLLRDQLRDAMSAPEVPAALPAARRRGWLEWFSAPNPAWAAAAACAVFLLFVPALRQGDAPTASVALESYRGRATDGQNMVAPAGSALELKLDTTGLADLNRGNVSVVDAVGETVWSGQAQTADGVLKTEVSTRLQPGLYWVRLTRDGQPDTLVREYRLEVK